LNIGVTFTEDSEEKRCIALKDIIENEELVQNYKDFDMEFDSYHDDLLSPNK